MVKEGHEKEALNQGKKKENRDDIHAEAMYFPFTIYLKV